MKIAEGRRDALAGAVADFTRQQLSVDTQFRQLMDAMPHIVWTSQPDGRCSYCNQRWLDYSGLSLQASLDHGWLQQVHADDREQVDLFWMRATSSNLPQELECRLRRVDGICRWMLYRAVPQRDADGRTHQWLCTFTDIDDLKQAARLLEKSFSMNRIAGKVARLGGWTIDLPERTLTWSDENCLIHDVPPGYTLTLDEGIGYFLPEHRPIVSRYVQDCAQHGIPYEFVLPKRTAKGRLIWVRSIGEAVRDAAGKIVRLQGAFQDISEQKEAEIRMLALESRLIITLESITDGFCLIDKHWRITFLNGQAERMFKRAPEELLGKVLWEEFPQALGTQVERELRLTIKEQRTTRFAAYFLPLKTWFHFNAYPTEAGIAIYFQDITQRREEQAQLRLLQTAVSRLNDMVVIMEAEPFDASGRRIVFVNHAFERQTGYSGKEVVGNTRNLFLRPTAQRPEMDRILAAMSRRQAVRAELVICTKAGEELWLETDITPIADEAGTLTHWVVVGRDIAERRQQQQEILNLNDELEQRVLRRTAQLAAANKELESFAYSVSHDLRSPLNTIHAFSQLLVKVDRDDISDKGKHYLDRIGAGVKQMGDLIDGLLTLTHLSREEMQFEQVDLSAIARRIGQDWREQAPQRQVRLTVEDGLTAQGDARLLAAVLENLLGNAWKFTSRQALTHIEVGCEPGVDGGTAFFVRDNGAGFDMAFAHKLFGTFERLHSPGDFSGTGIGLATVRRIIERHGGRVWADSKPDEGAIFFFTLALKIEAVR